MHTDLMIGQSQIAHLWSWSNQGLTSLAGGKRFQRPSPGPPAVYNVEDAHHVGEYDDKTVANADGALTLANVLGAALGDTVMQYQYAVGSTNIPDWISPNGAYYKYAVSPTRGFQLGGYPVDAIWWGQGGSDAGGANPMSYANYLLNLRNVEAWNQVASPGAPFFVSPIGRLIGFQNDANWDAIRQAQLYSIDNDANVFWGGCDVDLGYQDGVHLDGPGRVSYTKRFAQAYLRQRGLSTSGYGPKIESATYNGSVVTVTVTQEGAASLTGKNLSTTGTGLTGFRVFSNGILASIVSTSFAQPNQIVLTTSAPLNAPVTFDYQYGAHPVITNPVGDNQPPFGDANGLPLQPSRGKVTAIAA